MHNMGTKQSCHQRPLTAFFCVAFLFKNNFGSAVILFKVLSSLHKPCFHTSRSKRSYFYLGLSTTFGPLFPNKTLQLPRLHYKLSKTTLTGSQQKLEHSFATLFIHIVASISFSLQQELLANCVQSNLMTPECKWTYLTMGMNNDPEGFLTRQDGAS